MTKKIYITINRTTIKQGITTDILGYVLLGVFCWLNQKFIDGNNFIDAFVLVSVLSVCINRLSRKKYDGISEKKLKQIEKILEKEND